MSEPARQQRYERPGCRPNERWTRSRPSSAAIRADNTITDVVIDIFADGDETTPASSFTLTPTRTGFQRLPSVGRTQTAKNTLFKSLSPRRHRRAMRTRRYRNIRAISRNAQIKMVESLSDSSFSTDDARRETRSLLETAGKSVSTRSRAESLSLQQTVASSTSITLASQNILDNSHPEWSKAAYDATGVNPSDAGDTQPRM
jgi:hypothetical protein